MLNLKKTSKKVVSTVVAAFMIVASIPAYAQASSNTKTITLNTSSIATGDEKFSAYVFDGTTSAKFIDMRENGNTYTADVPATYSKVIFCRMPKTSTTNSWNNCWNQTYDLSLKDGDTYTLTNWAEGNKINGYWSKSTAQSSYISFTGSFNQWDTEANVITSTYRGGSTEMFLTKGSYEFKVVCVNSVATYWYGAANDVTIYDETKNSPVKVQSAGKNIRLNIATAGTYSFYYRVDTGYVSVTKVTNEDPTPIPTTYYSLAGSFNNWDTTKNIIESTYRGGSSKVYLTPGTYQFKFVYVNKNNKTWYGANNANLVDGTSPAVKVSTSGSNINLTVTKADTYSFYYRMDTGTICVSNA